MTPAVNLLPAARRSRLRRRSRVRGWSVTAAVYALALLGVWWGLVSLRPSDSDAAAQLSDVALRAQARDAELRELDRQIGVARAKADLANGVRNHPDWSELLRVLGAARGDDVAIERVSLTTKNNVQGKAGDIPERGPWLLGIGGVASTRRAATEFVSRLESAGVFDRVALTETRERGEALAGGALVDFALTCELSEQGQAGAARAGKGTR